MRYIWETWPETVPSFVRSLYGLVNSVPMIETAIEYAETADIFLIIGTLLNVYPAAGLLNYVPARTPVYLIDPKQVPIASGRKVHVIQKGASEGMEELKKILVG